MLENTVVAWGSSTPGSESQMALTNCRFTQQSPYGRVSWDLSLLQHGSSDRTGIGGCADGKLKKNFPTCILALVSLSMDMKVLW